MDNLDYYRIEKAINYLEANYKNQPDLDELAEYVGISSFHLQKVFKRWAGITPKKFLETLTLEHIKKVLNKNESLIGAAYDAGLSSSSRLYDLFINIEAVTPQEYKSKGRGMTIYYGFHETPFGQSLIAVTERGVCGLYFIKESETQRALAELKAFWSNSKIIHDQEKTKSYIDLIFFRNPSKYKKLDILVKGTNFQVQVWKALLQIPEGELRTYDDIAKTIDHPKALRAVGTAVGHSQISYIIPCHRVINKSGLIGNYRWGRERKKALLVRELSAI